MSAPWEVWISPSEWPVTLEAHPSPGGDRVRYLRADLTCGDCGKHGNHNGCAHDYHLHDAVNIVAQKHVWPNHGSPACMAFTPKEDAP
jgi:hypothetical protein